MFHGVKDITDSWDSYLTPVSLGDNRDEATAFEFTLEPLVRGGWYTRVRGWRGIRG